MSTITWARSSRTRTLPAISSDPVGPHSSGRSLPFVAWIQAGALRVTYCCGLSELTDGCTFRDPAGAPADSTTSNAAHRQRGGGAYFQEEVMMGGTRPILVQTLLAPFALAAWLWGPVAIAQQPPAASEQTGALQEVIVTATKRSQNLQDVPFSVSSTSEEQIRNSGAMNIVDLARNVAGLAIADLGPGQSQMSIRGISSGQVIRDQPGVKEQVGVYLDESPISVALFTPDLELFDLDRFEVLRGPQGTLFGAGSEAGTLRYITKHPKLGVTEAVADANVEEVIGNGNDIGEGFRGAANVPLGDTVAVRMVGYFTHQ